MCTCPSRFPDFAAIVTNGLYDNLPLRKIITSSFVKTTQSYGIILYCSTTKRSLVVQKKYNPAFLVLLRGTYRDDNLPNLLSHITTEENKLLKELVNDPVQARKVRDTIEFSVTEPFGGRTYFKTLLDSYQSQADNEWVWPRGAPEEKEEPLVCAKRELTEETGIILPPELVPITLEHKQSFVTSSGNIREIKYYLVIVSTEFPTRLETNNTEIKACSWLELKEIAKLVPDADVLITLIQKHTTSFPEDVSYSPSLPS